jgi:hypothetical protein
MPVEVMSELVELDEDEGSVLLDTAELIGGLENKGP